MYIVGLRYVDGYEIVLVIDIYVWLLLGERFVVGVIFKFCYRF